jgi:hypothetical protein
MSKTPRRMGFQLSSEFINGVFDGSFDIIALFAIACCSLFIMRILPAAQQK